MLFYQESDKKVSVHYTFNFDGQKHNTFDLPVAQ